MNIQQKPGCTDDCHRPVEVTLERDPRDRDNPTRTLDRWIAWFGEDILVDGSRDPEHDACRELLAMGITGKVTFRHKGSPHPSMTMTIEKSAQFTVGEDGKRFRLRKYIPFSSGPGAPKTALQGSGRCHPTLEAKRASTEQNDGGAS